MTHPGAFRHEVFLGTFRPLLETALKLKESIFEGQLLLPQLIKQAEGLTVNSTQALSLYIAQHSFSEKPAWIAVNNYAQELAEPHDTQFHNPKKPLKIDLPGGTPLEEVAEINHVRRLLNAVRWVVGFSANMETAMWQSHTWDQNLRYNTLDVITKTAANPCFSFVRQPDFVLTRAFYFYQILSLTTSEEAEKQSLLDAGILFYNKHSQFRPSLETIIAGLSRSLDGSISPSSSPSSH
jgi:hypothetical protein